MYHTVLIRKLLYCILQTNRVTGRLPLYVSHLAAHKQEEGRNTEMLDGVFLLLLT